MQETHEVQVRSLGLEDPLEEEMATYSSILSWKIPWTEEPGWLQSMESWRAVHDGAQMQATRVIQPENNIPVNLVHNFDADTVRSTLLVLFFRLVLIPAFWGGTTTLEEKHAGGN